MKLYVDIGYIFIVKYKANIQLPIFIELCWDKYESTRLLNKQIQFIMVYCQTKIKMFFS